MTTALLWVFVYTACAETVFCLAYGLLFPWRRSSLGRQMLLYSATVAALMDMTVLSMWWRPPAWLFLAVYVVFAVSLTWRLIILLRMWRDHRAPPANGRP